MQEGQVQSLGQEDPLEKGTATHSSILAWRIPWTEEPGGLKSMWSQRDRHNLSNLAHTHTHTCKTEVLQNTETSKAVFGFKKIIDLEKQSINR